MTADIRTAIRSITTQLLLAHAKLSALSPEQQHDPRAYRLREEMSTCATLINALKSALEACDG
jgi:hypothetical protein